MCLNDKRTYCYIQNFMAFASIMIYGIILELVVRLAHKYGLGEKNVRCLFTHSSMLQLLQLLLFATTIYLSKMIDPSKKHAH